MSGRPAPGSDDTLELDLPAALPVTSRQRRGHERVLLALGAIAVVAGLALAVRAAVGGLSSRCSQPGPEADRANPQQPSAGSALASIDADTDGDGCPERIRWDPTRAILTRQSSGGSEQRLAIGMTGDQLVIGDWNCDGTATPAVYSASRGELTVFDIWPAPGDTAALRGRSEVREREGRVQLKQRDPGGRGCDSVVIDR